MNKETIKNTKKNFQDELEIISNAQYQKRVWVKGNGPECDCYIENMCRLGGDYDCLFEAPKEFGYTEEQLNLLTQLWTLLDEYDEPGEGTDAEIVNDPEWDKIRQFAKKTLESISST